MERPAWIAVCSSLLAVACNPPAASSTVNGPSNPTAETVTPVATVSPVSAPSTAAPQTATAVASETAVSEAGPAACSEGQHVGEESKVPPAAYAACKDNSECTVVATRGCCTVFHTAVAAQYAHCVAPEGPGANCRAHCPQLPPKLVGSECRTGGCELIK